MYLEALLCGVLLNEQTQIIQLEIVKKRIWSSQHPLFWDT